MKRFRQLSLRGRLGLLFAGAGVLMAIGVTVSSISFARLLDARHSLVDNMDPAELQTQLLLTTLVNQETGVRGYVLTHETRFLDPYYQSLGTQRGAQAELAHLLSNDTAVLDLVQRADAAAARWRVMFAVPAIAATRAGETTYASAAATARSQVLFNELRTAMGRLRDALVADRQAAVAKLDSSTTGLVGVLVMAAIVFILLGAGVWRALRVWVSVPLVAVGGDARTVAGGDLDHAVAPAGPPEFVRLATDVEAMRRRILVELDSAELARAELAGANAELSAANTDLGRSNLELEQFAYVASHDLQEPLRKVTSFVQLLQQRYQGELDDRAQQYIEFAVDGARRMQGLVNDLLAFSRVGRTSEQLTEVRLSSCVQEALKRLESAVEESGADVMIGTLPTVRGDAGLLATLFQNLLANSLKFRSSAAPQIRVDSSDEGAWWIVSVTDNGIGIEERFAERVFVIFQRLHARDAYEGTGIGLALAKKIAEFHDGEIWLDTAHQGGTRMCLRLPKLIGEEGR